MKQSRPIHQLVASKEPINKQFTIGLITGMLMLNGLLLPDTAYLAGKSNSKVDRSAVIVKVADNGNGNGASDENGDSNGDGGPAINSVLYNPEGVAIDSAGNIFIADTFHGIIRKIVTSGKITTIGGNGRLGSGDDDITGDGGPALKARVNLPVGVAVDAKGNIYFADKSNHRVRKIDTSGIISTVIGTGNKGYSGDGGPAFRARLFEPLNVNIDAAGNLFIVDSGNNCIRKVDTSGVITTVAGNGHHEFSGDGGPAVRAALKFPTEVAVDAKGNLYISDKYNNRIRKVDRSGVITTVAGTGKGDFSGDGGPAINAALNGPTGVAVDSNGNIFIADSHNHRIRKVDRDGIITSLAGTGKEEFSGDGGPGPLAGLYYPESVKADGAGNVYIADTGNNRIRKIDGSGKITTVAGNGKKAAVDLNVTFEK